MSAQVRRMRQRILRWWRRAGQRRMGACMNDGHAGHTNGRAISNRESSAKSTLAPLITRSAVTPLSLLLTWRTIQMYTSWSSYSMLNNPMTWIVYKVGRAVEVGLIELRNVHWTFRVSSRSEWRELRYYVSRKSKVLTSQGFLYKLLCF